MYIMYDAIIYIYIYIYIYIQYIYSIYSKYSIVQIGDIII